MTPPDSASTDLLSVQEAGPSDAPVVVILHGWGSNSAVMRGFVEHLRSDFKTLNVDLPGHGSAPVPTRPLDMDDHARAVVALVEAHGGQAHLVGHSNGGRIGLYMASDPRYQQCIQSLTLVSPSGVRRPRSAGFYLRKYLAMVLKAPFAILPGPMKGAGLDWLRHSLLWKALGSSDYRSLEGTMRETFVKLVNTYVEKALPDIAVPVLLFWGTRDNAVLKPQIDRLVDDIPDAGLVVLEDAGHYGFIDSPDEVYAGCRHFLLASRGGNP